MSIQPIQNMAWPTKITRPIWSHCVTQIKVAPSPAAVNGNVGGANVLLENAETNK